MIQAKTCFSRTLLCVACVMYCRSVMHYSFARNLPEESLAQRLLRHAPRIERSEWPHDVRNPGLLTHMRGRYGRVIEHGMNVGEVEALNIRAQP